MKHRSRPSRIHRALGCVLLLGIPFALACVPPDAKESAAPAVTVLARGGPYRGVNGILFGPDGRLYIASVVTPVLAAIDPESGAVAEQWGAEQGVKGPDDLAFGPDGSLYWTDILFGEVGRRTPDGTVSVVANLGPGVNPITFSDDGRLFVSQCFMGDRLYEVDPEGKAKPRLISDQLGPGCGLNGMDWGPDGQLYGPRWFRGEVARVDVDTGAVETAADGFKVPAAVKFDSQGRLHVLDTLAGEVLRVDLASGAREVVGRPGPGVDNLAFDREDRLFISSFADGFVAEVTGPDSLREISAGGINIPGGIAYAPSGDGSPGRLFLADFFALRQLDPQSGGEVHAVRDVIGFSEQGSVMTAQWNGEHLVLTSWLDNMVRLWDPENDSLVARFEGFGRPIDATSYGGDILVSEYDSGSVLRFAADTPEERTAVATGLQEPAGLAVHDGDLFVADRGAGTLLQILDDGAVLDPPRQVASGLAGPEGVAAAVDGTLYVVEADAARVTRVAADGTTTAVAEGLEIHVPSQGDSPSSMLFNGIAVGDGHLYVSGDQANIVYRIDR